MVQLQNSHWLKIWSKVLFHHLRADWENLNNYEFAAENRVMISFREGKDESSL